ncbi:hypothetical protein [Streptomyces kanasensis]|uniref:hypothetical protein n=1 Tax=Streptomyces kanasensis TaxID=936756 RepID=UPI0036FF95A3
MSPSEWSEGVRMPRLPGWRPLRWGGPAALAAGAVLCVLGWYGVSGERSAERQLPYLASGTVPGAALLVVGAVWIAAAARTPAAPGPTAQNPDAEGGEGGGAVRPSSDAPPVRVPRGTLAHRPDCPLVAGRPEAVPAGDAPLRPCPVCEPGPRDGDRPPGDASAGGTAAPGAGPP